MANVTIIYGSTTGNTESSANEIAEALSAHTVTVKEVASASKEDFEGADLLILGTSTWGLGDLQDDWEGEISTLEGANLSGKKVAIFGHGDSASYCDTFVDGVGILYEAAVNAGATVIGKVANEGYSHSASRAEVNGEFVGLPLDDDNSDASSERIAAWVADLASQI